MKKMLLSFLSVLVSVNIAFAEMPTDKDYENLDELRVKIVRMKREMDKFMKDILSTYPPESTLGNYGQDVKVDVTQTPADVIVRADLPGMAKDKIEVTLENSIMLKIAGARDVSTQETAPGIVRQERMQGRFERVIQLPAECRNDGIQATYKDGVLEIVIPKKETTKEKPVKVSIQ
ncbi:MAG TPA: Hsp20/alpha crystallin family protein [Candidatus Omnitrophota bacterium]|nr:Hsp20/alpha crystallin family protein [Candidatus Omnitrophota bacterium]